MTTYYTRAAPPRLASPSRPAGFVLLAGREPARVIAGTPAPSGSQERGTPATGRDNREHLEALPALVDAVRNFNDLSASEIRVLNLIAFADHRSQERRGELQQLALSRQTFKRKIVRFMQDRLETALVASIGTNGAQVQSWDGTIGVEGQLTGDGRLIQFGALTFAAFPLPLRYVEKDVGGHDGAVVVGRIDRIERRSDGSIYASGVLDLGSQQGSEVARLIGAGMLNGISLDLDGTTSTSGTVEGKPASLTSAGRVRAATIVAIPAFDDARVVLAGDPHHDHGPVTDDADDCGCADPSEPGFYN